MSDEDVRSLSYLRELSRLHDDWENDSACVCCDWAAGEIERLRKTRVDLMVALAHAVDAFESGEMRDFGIIFGGVQQAWLTKAKEILLDELLGAPHDRHQ